MKCLFESFAYFFIRLFVFLSWALTMYIFQSLFSAMCVADFPQSVTCHFIIVTLPLDAQKLIKFNLSRVYVFLNA